METNPAASRHNCVLHEAHLMEAGGEALALRETGVPAANDRCSL